MKHATPLLALCLTITALAACSAPKSPTPEPIGRRPQSEPSPQDVILPPSTVLSVQPWTDFPGETGVVIRTNAYRIFITARDRRLIRALPPFCEQALSSYRTALAYLPAPPAKLDTYLVDSRAQWETLTRIVARRNSETYLQIGRGGFAINGAGYFWDIGFADTLSLTAHEGWHQYTQRTFKQRLPPWLEEGVATYFEGLRLESPSAKAPRMVGWANTERFDRLRELVAEGRLIPLDELVRLTPGDLISTNEDLALDWYAQIWAAIHFLREAENARYAPALATILRDAAAGTLWRKVSRRIGRSGAFAALRANGAGAVLSTYIDTPQDELAASYEGFVRRVVAPGSRDRIVEGRSPF